MNPTEAITVSITRTVKAGCEADFERALHDFVQRSLTLPGQQGVHVMRPAPGSGSREYGIIRKFANREALAAFSTSPEYLAWNQLAVELTEGAGRVEELTGLESWFTLPGAPLVPLAKWKMAVATFLGVFPVATGLNLTLGPAIRSCRGRAGAQGGETPLAGGAGGGGRFAFPLPAADAARRASER